MKPIFQGAILVVSVVIRKWRYVNDEWPCHVISFSRRGQESKWREQARKIQRNLFTVDTNSVYLRRAHVPQCIRAYTGRADSSVDQPTRKISCTHTSYEFANSGLMDRLGAKFSTRTTLHALLLGMTPFFLQGFKVCFQNYVSKLNILKGKKDYVYSQPKSPPKRLASSLSVSFLPLNV